MALEQTPDTGFFDLYESQSIQDRRQYVMTVFSPTIMVQWKLYTNDSLFFGMYIYIFIFNY